MKLSRGGQYSGGERKRASSRGPRLLAGKEQLRPIVQKSPRCASRKLLGTTRLSEALIVPKGRRRVAGGKREARRHRNRMPEGHATRRGAGADNGLNRGIDSGAPPGRDPWARPNRWLPPLRGVATGYSPPSLRDGLWPRRLAGSGPLLLLSVAAARAVRGIGMTARPWPACYTARLTSRPATRATPDRRRTSTLPSFAHRCR